MLKDKRADLDAEKRKKLIARIVKELSRENIDLYYQSTSAIARLVKQHVDSGSNLSADDKSLLETLDQRDIEVLLSLH
ncbi:MAG: hypothetical protein AAF362_03215 [Pseudomonadota bacterium]